MKRLIATVASAVLLLASLTACEDTVVARDANRDGRPAIQVEDKDGNRKWIPLTRDQYDRCSKGETWPACGGEAYGSNPGNQDYDEKDDRIIAVVNVGSSNKKFVVDYNCAGDFQHHAVPSRSFHKRCLLRKGQTVSVTGIKRNAVLDCNITIIMGEEVVSDIGGGRVRCSWTHNR